MAYEALQSERLIVYLPKHHRLAAFQEISPQDLVGETFLAVANTAPVLRRLVDDYLKRSGVNIVDGYFSQFGAARNRRRGRGGDGAGPVPDLKKDEEWTNPKFFVPFGDIVAGLTEKRAVTIYDSWSEMWIAPAD